MIPNGGNMEASCRGSPRTLGIWTPIPALTWGVIKWDVTMLPWESGLNKYLALFLGIVHAKKRKRKKQCSYFKLLGKRSVVFKRNPPPIGHLLFCPLVIAILKNEEFF